MVTHFDIAIFLGVLLAMLLSRMPKQFAMSVALICSLGIMGANYLIGAGDYLFWAIIGIEVLSALVLIKTLPRLQYSDRFFYRLMSGMFLIAAAVHVVYLATPLTFVAYTHVWQSVAVAHVLLMTGNADGIGSLVRDIGIRGNPDAPRSPDYRR